MSRPRTRADTIWRATASPAEIAIIEAVDGKLSEIEAQRAELCAGRHVMINRIAARARSRRKRSASVSIVS